MKRLSTLGRLAWTRRDLIKALGLGGLSWASSRAIPAADLPWPDCIGTEPAAHRRIDAHVHIFNGTDLQIAGFLRTSVANEYPLAKPLLKWIAGPLQAFVWKFSPTADRELKRLNQIAGEGGVRTFSQAAFATSFAADRAETEAQYADFLYQQFQDEKFRNLLDQMIPTAASESALLKKALRSAPVVDGTAARDLARRVDAATGIPVFDYLEPYFSYRYVNFLELVQQFTCAHDTNIDTFVALLVDFDQPLGKPGKNPPSSIDEQTQVISRICQLSRGRLLALAPYCPFKDVAHQGASLHNVTQAWMRPGFVGAKIYPPMGFYPLGLGNKPTIDAALRDFYHECLTADAPIMAHAGSSLCIDGRPCQYPGPPGWQIALEEAFKIKQQPLRVCLGHFGGPFDQEAKDWPGNFVKLMEVPSGQLLYADLAYAKEVLDKSKDKHNRDRLVGLLTSPSPLSDRLLYGTDWLMLGLESKWPDYAIRMESVIAATEQASGLQGLGARVFGGNAHHWLGLDRPGSLAYRNSTAL